MSKPRVVILLTDGELSVESDTEIELHVLDFSDFNKKLGTPAHHHQQFPGAKTPKQLDAYMARWLKKGGLL